jgi:hypothetical protein
LVKFDIESDIRFRDSLTDLDASASVEIIEGLRDIDQQNYSWQDFVDTFGWHAMGWTGENTYPGANETHYFFLWGHSGQLYELFGYTYDQIIVICALARLA